MTDASAFTKLVPGFDFLQSLVKNAGSALPGIGQWIAPTLNPEELEKKIEELRTVQFWLEQNARMLGATIQAMEVQRMTLSTLKTMNVQMGDLRDSLKIRMPEPPAEAEAEAEADVAEAPAPAAAPAVPLAGAVDPMQWWGALTKQFTQLATTAMKDTATDAAKAMAGAVVKQSLSAAGKTLTKASGAPARAVRAARKSVAEKGMAARGAAANRTADKGTARKSTAVAAPRKKAASR